MLDEDATLADVRVSVKRGATNRADVDDLLRRSRERYVWSN